MKWLASILVNAIVLIVVAGYFDSFYLSGVGAAIIASVILSILNVIVKPILILLTLPVTVLTLGFFLFVINAITLWITAGLMGDAFHIDGFGMAILAAIFISILNVLIQKVIIEPLQKK
ncbi:phage holin family protein [Sutcliffiella sp. NC1]|uniref:phage holin family protein n=1 Tax=Sutcliffiella sp. NC1 TaxID=3004096 RepID=UPI0022DE5305|nr:phage holin family protein [Sutcliffiella sp. NC1]WBL14455.1 phage holin family protein [Sutcliffiella sp. NC1]